MTRRWPPLLLVCLAGALLAGCAEPGPATLVGTLERDRIELQAESNEPIVAIRVSDGAPVEAGEVILEQDPRRHQAVLDRRLAERDLAAARLAELQRGPREEAIREARAQLEAQQTLAANARREHQRAQEIFDRGLSSTAAVDAARTAMESALAQEQARREALAALLSGTTVEELAQQAAALRAAEAAVREAELALERLRLAAPVPGRLDRVLFEVGERPAPGATVAVLLDESRPYARVYVPEHLRARVQPGAALEVAVDGHPDRLRGTVRWVSADASFTPYFALTEHDRSRLSYLAEIDLPAAAGLPSGLPLEALPAAD